MHPIKSMIRPESELVFNCCSQRVNLANRDEQRIRKVNAAGPVPLLWSIFQSRICCVAEPGNQSSSPDPTGTRRGNPVFAGQWMDASKSRMSYLH
ncbi:hypothetical protein N7456_010141 [Penicillium angulare]|uniref:Uncharacterized protein n=1 Tax=Penicillium angulare TaxID=116970 RepID=A0A9W9F625_9EURO|nr:hypothetical protein N7456_010141 [Penicillium angulare]